MSYTIQNAQDELAGLLKGKTVNKVTNINGVARRAAVNLLNQIDPAETVRQASITLYDDVIDYALPMTDLKEKRIIDIRPQVTRQRSDNFSSRFSKEFDLKKWNNWFSIEDDSGTKFIRVSKNLSPGAASLDPLDSTTGFTASGDASNLAVDSIYSVSDGDSLKFDLAASGSSGLITKSTITSVDLSDAEGSAALFLWVYLPSASTDITSVTLRFGSSATAYWEALGAIHFGSQRQGWNLFRFTWPTTKTGSPNSAAITYVRMAFAYAGTAVSGIRIDKLFASLPRIWSIWYYSKFLFKTSAGVWKETVSDTSDIINLDTISYNLYVYELKLAALEQVTTKDGISTYQTAYKELYGDGQNKRGLYSQYRKNNPTQTEKPTQSYYSNLRFRRK